MSNAMNNSAVSGRQRNKVKIISKDRCKLHRPKQGEMGAVLHNMLQMLKKI